MSEFLIFIIMCVVISLVIYSSVLITDASVKIGSGNSDPNLAEAYKLTTWASVLVWLTVAGLIILLIVTLIYGPELFLTFGSTITYIILFIAVIGIVVIGSIAAASTYYIGQSDASKSGDILTAYDDTLYASLICFGAIFLFGLLYYFSWRRKNEINNVRNVQDYSEPQPQYPQPQYPQPQYPQPQYPQPQYPQPQYPQPQYPQPQYPDSNQFNMPPAYSAGSQPPRFPPAYSAGSQPPKFPPAYSAGSQPPRFPPAYSAGSQPPRLPTQRFSAPPQLTKLPPPLPPRLPPRPATNLQNVRRFLPSSQQIATIERQAMRV